MTIHPLAGATPTSEEAAANTHISFKRAPALTNEQLAALRAAAPKNPDSHSARAAQAVAEREARRNAAKK